MLKRRIAPFIYVSIIMIWTKPLLRINVPCHRLITDLISKERDMYFQGLPTISVIPSCMILFYTHSRKKSLAILMCDDIKMGMSPIWYFEHIINYVCVCVDMLWWIVCLFIFMDILWWTLYYRCLWICRYCDLLFTYGWLLCEFMIHDLLISFYWTSC